VVTSACVGGCDGVLGCCPCAGLRLAAPGWWVGVRECVLWSGGHGARRRSRAVPHLADVQSEGEWGWVSIVVWQALCLAGFRGYAWGADLCLDF
jgi:hypothetical protein